MKKSFYIYLIILGLGIFSPTQAAISPPELTSPCNDQTAVSLTPELNWQPVKGAWLYTWEVFLLKDGERYQRVDMGGTPKDKNPHTYGVVKPDRLTPDNSYQWHARSQDKGYNLGDWSEWCEFNTNAIPPIEVAPGEPTIVGVNPPGGPVGTSIGITGENFHCIGYNPEDNTVIFTGDNDQVITENSPSCDGFFTIKSTVPNFPESVKTLAIKVQVKDKMSNPFVFSLTAQPVDGPKHPGGPGAGKLELDWPASPGFGTKLDDQSGITDLLKYLYEWLISLGGLTAFIFLIYAGFQYLTSAGDPGKTREAKNRITSAFIGLILLFASVLILNTINPQLTVLKIPLPPLQGGESEIKIGEGFDITPEACTKVVLFSGENHTGTAIPISKDGANDNMNTVVKSIKFEGDCLLILYQLTEYESTDSKPPLILTSDVQKITGETLFQSAKVVSLSE